MKIQLFPFHRTEINRLIGEADFETNDIRKVLIDTFGKLNIGKVMNEKEAADFILMELTGDTEKAKVMAEKL